MSARPQADRPSRYLEWVHTLALWDGCLPLAVGIVGPLANGLFPRHPDVGVLCAVFVPILAFFLRLRIGSLHFETHPHYVWQSLVFFLAILWLVLLDAVLILFRLIPKLINAADWGLWGLMYGGYLCLMAVALFPRPGAVAEFETDHYQDL